MAQSIEDLVQDAADEAGGARQVRAAARLMSHLEQAPHRLPELFQALPLDAWPQPRLVLGVTGAPGSGKSTLTDQLVATYRQAHPDGRVGVIAVDPSSPFTGGSVLGDRVRMMRHATDPKVFIRSLATRGHLGGLSLGVKGVLRVMGLIGCDVVLIETVGVGQSEIEVTTVADLVLVVLAPGQGDAVQMLKAGLMEIADIFVVNKADREGADMLHHHLMQALSLGRNWDTAFAETLNVGCDAELADAAMARRKPEAPEVYLVSATNNTGMQELFEGLEARAARNNGHWQTRRDAAVREEVREAVLEEARRRLHAALTRNDDDPVQRVLAGELTIDDLTQRLLEQITNSK